MAGNALHLVFGGELKNLATKEFADPNKIDVVGIFPNYDEALTAWRAAAQASVDQATTRYFVANLTQLREPE